MLTTQTYRFSQDPSFWVKHPWGDSICILKEALWQLFLMRGEPEEPSLGTLVPRGEMARVALGANSYLQLVSKDKKIKGNAYPSTIPQGQETQLPIVGDEHLVFVVSGTLECFERSTGKMFSLSEGEILRVSRPNRKKEYLNLRVQGKTEKNSFVWLVIHYLSHY